MKKHVAAVRLVDCDEATEAVGLPEALRRSLGAIAGVAREGLLAIGTTVGLAVMGEMMTAEMTVGSRATGRCRPSSLRWPVTSRLLGRRGMLHESHERANRRPPRQWSRLEAGRSGRPWPKP